MRNDCYLSIALTGLLLALPLAAQEEDVSAPVASGEPTTNVAASVQAEKSEKPEEVEEADDSDELDDADLDEQTYEEDDDDFVPSEEIPADTPIPFPSNI